MKKIRCAIYTRKSSEEGLEQDFNSLDAQREACAAYVRSQAGQGWTEIGDSFDDGGLSGGTLERPALQRLLGEIVAGRVDIVVVYKVDRLTRSLLDFAKLVECFDQAGVSFVSVTQSFNTTTSMGRLTLNMLLSFAQFEREVTAERIRDKIAASKARGMWMGGVPPLGYAPDGRTLKIVPEEAALIRSIFDRYLELKSVRLVADALIAQGILSPVRTIGTGKSVGGRHFSRGQLYFMLKSPIYAGDIPHRDKSYPGMHEAIIDRATWAAVQTLLAEQTQGSRRAGSAPRHSPLSGRVFDADGTKLMTSHTCKGSRRYLYYVRERQMGSVRPTLRIPAAQLEAAVAQCVADALADPVGLLERTAFHANPNVMTSLADRAAEIAKLLGRRDPALLRSLVHRVQLADDRIIVKVSRCELEDVLKVSFGGDQARDLTLESRTYVRRTGRVVRLVEEDGVSVKREVSRSLISVIVKARRWWRMLREDGLDVTTLARREGITPSYVTRVVRLAFLSPSIVDTILAGNLPAAIDAMTLTAPGAVDPDWKVQEAEWLKRDRSRSLSSLTRQRANTNSH